MHPLRWFRAPWLHFLVGGAVLFRLVHGPTPFAAVAHGGPPAPIVVSAADVERLRTEYTRDTGLSPTPDDESALIDKAVDEELLFREAVARGLDRNDRSVRTWLIEQMAVLTDGPVTDGDRLYAQARALGLDRSDLVVRRILVQKMRLLAARLDERAPADDTLQAYYAAHRDDYVPPARVSLWHVFLGSASHGADAARAAGVLLDGFRRDGVRPADAARAGDAFPMPPHLVSQSPSQIEKIFGPAFATQIGHAPAGAWSGPFASAYGVHLVWVEAREPGIAPAFEHVRQQVLERWQSEQRATRLATLVRELARRYPLQVESAAWRGRSAS